MTLQDFTYVALGAALASSLFTLFYGWSTRVITDKWLAVTAKNLATARESVAKAWSGGYLAAYNDMNKAARPTNDRGVALPLGPATLIPDPDNASPQAFLAVAGQSVPRTDDFNHYFGKDERNA